MMRQPIIDEIKQTMELRDRYVQNAQEFIHERIRMNTSMMINTLNRKIDILNDRLAEEED